MMMSHAMKNADREIIKGKVADLVQAHFDAARVIIDPTRMPREAVECALRGVVQRALQKGILNSDARPRKERRRDNALERRRPV